MTADPAGRESPPLTPDRHVLMTGTFGLRPKGTMSARALPLARELMRRGHRVTMVLPPWDAPEDGNRDRSIDGVRVIELPVSCRPNLAGFARLSLDVVRFIRDLQPDIVHCFKPKGIGGLAAEGLLRGRGRGLSQARVVIDADDWEGSGGWNDRAGYSAPIRTLFAWQERQLLTRADAVTAASHELWRIASLMRGHDGIEYVPNALPALPPLDDSWLPEPNLILLYTRFAEFDPARAAAVLARLRAGNPDAKLLVVGRGLAGEEALFVHAAEAAGVSGALEYRGWVDGGELPATLRRAAVAIVPFDDTLLNRCKSSVKLLELMALGIAVVADGVGENREVIRHEVSGLLVRPGDVTAMSEAVAALLADPERARQLGRAARDCIDAGYLWPQRVATVEAAYAG